MLFINEKSSIFIYFLRLFKYLAINKSIFKLKILSGKNKIIKLLLWFDFRLKLKFIFQLLEEFL